MDFCGFQDDGQPRQMCLLPIYFLNLGHIYFVSINYRDSHLDLVISFFESLLQVSGVK